MNRPFLPLTALLLVFAACRSEQETSTGRMRVEQIPAAVKGEMSTTEKVGETGRNHGYIRRFYQDKGRYYVTVDYIQYLSGADAVAAAKRRGDAQEEVQNGDTVYSVFDDYYIVNDDRKQRTWPVGEDAVITLWDRTPGTTLSQDQVTAAELLSKDKAFFEHAPFIVETKQGVVTSITEQYIP
jgi:hypothetical protein